MPKQKPRVKDRAPNFVARLLASQQHFQLRCGVRCTFILMKQHPTMVIPISRKSRLLRWVLLSVLVLPSSSAFLLPSSLYGTAGKHCAQAIAMLPQYECTTAAVMAGLGDALAQKQGSSERPEPYQWSRTLKFMLKGLGEGLIWSIWYRRAEIWSVHLTAALLGTSPSPALARLVNTIISLILDLTVACPLVYAFCKNKICNMFPFVGVVSR